MKSKLERGRALGADFGINHYTQKISEEVKKITNREGVDIVVEHVGAATWEESVKSLKTGGTLVTCGATTGRRRRYRSPFPVFTPVLHPRLLHGHDGRTV